MTTVDFKGACKRKRVRLNYMAAVVLTTSTGLLIDGNLRDIGVDSIFVKTEADTSNTVNQQVDVSMTITRGKSSMTIRTRGNILRTDSQGCAVHFLEPLKWWPVFSLFSINDSFMLDLVSAT